MGQLKIEGVTHWSIPVNNSDESEKFYGDLLGLKHLGRLGNSGMSCFNVGDHNILLCTRSESVDKNFVEERNVHHSFTVRLPLGGHHLPDRRTGAPVAGGELR